MKKLTKDDFRAVLIVKNGDHRYYLQQRFYWWTFSGWKEYWLYCYLSNKKIYSRKPDTCYFVNLHQIREEIEERLGKNNFQKIVTPAELWIHEKRPNPS